MKAQHTPGPWESIGATGIFRMGENGGAVAIIAEPECRYSSDIHRVEIGSKRWDEAMANARLIEAAPDLLADLIQAREIIDNLAVIVHGKKADGSTIARIDATITKAGGDRQNS